ncbi:4Fe-4S dicluster domain-containing protein [Gaoshiqia sp. Z1-71]|uniref:4Fe-4S dicluster domain-containing protein n=1 Tax=Gaoshiqia hydrogeniformans TaxID=3290090 RepID=UPI003BF88ACF
MILYPMLLRDVRFVEGLKACMNCGVCTAICPAAEFFDYDPRMLVVEVRSRDDERIEKLLRSETIWYCGQCMSCKTRCPRGNCPGLVINALRKLSQELGFFTESRRGRQQYALKKVLINNILERGYCVHPDSLKPELHPEQGPVWEWFFENRKELYNRLGANLDKEGAGTLRKIAPEVLAELKAIFDESGATAFLEKIENYSREKAAEMGIQNEDMESYFTHVFTTN